MDPDAALAHILLICAKVDEAGEQAPEELIDLVEHIEGLDEWIRKGGYLPAAWIDHAI